MYKVVRNVDGRLYSYCSFGGSVEYCVGVKTLPTIAKSKLFVFSDLNFAKGFLRKEEEYNLNNLEIWECEVENPKSSSSKLSSILNIKLVEDFWAGDTTYSGIAPLGTRLVDSVTLTKRVR